MIYWIMLQRNSTILKLLIIPNKTLIIYMFWKSGPNNVSYTYAALR